MITERRHDVEEFFKGDEPAAMSQLVLIDSFREFLNFRPAQRLRVDELATFPMSVRTNSG